MLESYDDELARGRNKKLYRDKGQKVYVHPLDEAMHMDKIGLISTNLAEKIALTITGSPYRVTADIINETCGQSISAQGVWNLIQQPGERIDEEENHAVKQMHADQAAGTRMIPIPFSSWTAIIFIRRSCEK